MPGVRNRKLIEVAMPLEAINAASAREKSILHGHPSTLHLWWARRPLAACRAVLFAQLVDDPSSRPDRFPTGEAINAERERLFEIMRDLVVWANSFDERVLEQARTEIRNSCGEKLPRIRDPFSGGGSVTIEAQRLGLPAAGSDLNPIAVLIGKAAVEFPARFVNRPPVHSGGCAQMSYRNSEGLAEDVVFYGNLVAERTFKRMGIFYPDALLPPEMGGGVAATIAWLWSRTVPSPDPAFGGLPVPITSNFLLSSKPGREVWLEPVVDSFVKDIRYRVRKGGTREEIATARRGTKVGRGANFRCLMSGAAITPDHVKAAGRAGELGQQLLAIVASGPKGKVYLPPDVSHEEAALAARAEWRPDLRFNNNALGFRVGAYGFETWGDLFTERQLATLNAFSNVIAELRGEIERDAVAAGFLSGGGSLSEGGAGAEAYSEAVITYLALVLGKCTDYWSSLCSWHASLGAMRNTFARQAIPMVWDFAEANPFSGSTGSWHAMLEWVRKAISRLASTDGVSVFQQDAQTVQYERGTAVCTDPPYYDNIGYADLSDFFHCWLRPLLKDIHPGLFRSLATPKSDELVATPFRHSGKKGAETFFLEGMSDSIANMARSVDEAFPVAIFYAFKQKEIEKNGTSSTGWATFLEAIIKSGYSIVGTWPVRTEKGSRIRALGSSALASSVVLVCRKRSENAGSIGRAAFAAALKREMPPAIADMTKAGIAPADLPQSAIGPGIGVYSRYNSVLESDDSPMPVKCALQLINRQLDEYQSGIAGQFDGDTRFAITWFEQYGFGKGAYGAADSIATARNILVKNVADAGVIEEKAGKIRLRRRDELDAAWDPATDQRLTVWECLQHLIRVFEDKGETAAGELLGRIDGAKRQDAKELAHILYNICSTKRRDAIEALAYNSLVAAWPMIVKVSTEPQTEAVVQLEMKV